MPLERLAFEDACHLESRDTWNCQWEAEIASFYKRTPLPLSEDMSRAMESTRNVSQYYLSMIVKELLDLQNDLAIKAVRRLHCDDLERKWTSLSLGQRRAYCLDGLYAASTVYGSDMGARRRWCPELTLDYLTDNPATYVALLRLFIPNNLEHKITDPIMVENSMFNHLIRGMIQSQIDRWRHERMTYFSLAMWRILLVLYDEDEEGQVVVSPTDTGARNLPRDRDFEKASKQSLGGIEYRNMKRQIKARRIADNQAKHYCATCKCTAQRISQSGGPPLKRCSSCNAVGRIVEYCSEVCQKKDWKTGEPVPHKRICGTAMRDMPEIDFAQYRSGGSRFREDLIPQPRPGFRRSPMLLKQIENVQEPPYVDYILPDGTGCNFMDGTDRELFMVVRRRAFQNGDAISVGELFTMLYPYMAKNDISATAFAKQLHQEYGLTSFDRVLSMTDIRPASAEETVHAQRAIAVIGRRGPATPEAPWVPKPDERQWGRKPPAALAKQVEYLNKPPYVDYVAFRPPPYDDVGINCPIQRDMILALRRRAIDSGDKVAATMLLLLLSPLVELRYRDDFAAQFRKEYDITEAELARVIQELGDEEASPQEPAAKLTSARHGQSAAGLPHSREDAAPDPRAVAVVGPRNSAMMLEGDPEPEYSG